MLLGQCSSSTGIMLMESSLWGPAELLSTAFIYTLGQMMLLLLLLLLRYVECRCRAWRAECAKG